MRKKKILPFAPASKFAARASSDEAAFNDSFAVLENLETDHDPAAPKTGAGIIEVDEKYPNAKPRQVVNNSQTTDTQAREAENFLVGTRNTHALTELARRLRHELEPALTAIATETACREHERTREWLDKHGLPKAARVAQREAYNVLRQHGVIKDKARPRAERENVTAPSVTFGASCNTVAELEELASTCFAMHEIHGHTIDATLNALCAGTDNRLSVEDAAKVRALADAMIRAKRAPGQS